MIRRLGAAVRAWLRQCSIRWNVVHRADRVDLTNVIGGQRRVGTVKAWTCRGQTLHVGDPVPHLSERSTYSVETLEGFFVNVGKGRIQSWSAKPVMASVADPFGRIWSHGGGRMRRALR